MNAAAIFQTGDVIITGPQSNLIFVLGQSALHVRQDSLLSVERGAALSVLWGETEAKSGRMLTTGKAINHSDDELEYLVRRVAQRTAWQIAGKKVCS